MAWMKKGELVAKEMREIDDELIDTVKEYLDEGKSEDEIRKILKEGPRFSDTEVDEILERAKKD